MMSSKRYFIMFAAAFVLLQVTILVWGAMRIILISSNLSAGKRSFLIIAKSSGALINLNLFLTLATFCRKTFQNFVPFVHHSQLVTVHILSASIMFTASLVHSLAHICNLLIFEGLGKFINITIILGFLLVVLYSLMVFGGWARRKLKYEVFQYTHFLAIPNIIITTIHVSFCWVKDGDGKCVKSTLFYWIVPPLALYLSEIVYDQIQIHRFTFINKVIKHPSSVIELQIKKKISYKAGQYIYIKLPDISRFQWHPFTITSAPEEDYLGVHVRICGGWTRKLEKLIGNPNTCLEKVRIKVSGPFGDCGDCLNRFKVIVCIGAGIGQTPFASILKSLWFKFNMQNHPHYRNINAVHFVGISKDFKALEWFNEILVALEQGDHNHLIHTHFYVTGQVPRHTIDQIAKHHELGMRDPITGLASATMYGRPHIRQLLSNWSNQYGSKIAVFFCGPKVFGESILEDCKYLNKHQNSRFVFYKESF